jgi:hypothetical protein
MTYGPWGREAVSDGDLMDLLLKKGGPTDLETFDLLEEVQHLRNEVVILQEHIDDIEDSVTPAAVAGWLAFIKGENKDD